MLFALTGTGYTRQTADGDTWRTKTISANKSN